jgi:flavin-dependent dehydrogenase
MMLENAAEKGADVRTGVKVDKVLFDGSEDSDKTAWPEGRFMGVEGKDPRGGAFRIHANVLVDATGLGALLSRQLGITRKDTKLDKAAVYAHFVGAQRDPGIDEGATLIINTRENRGWFWYIPLSKNRVSVGVVGDRSELLKGRGTPADILEEEIEACPVVRERVANACRSTDVHVTSDYTWRSTRCAGDGFVLVGDAFGFIDPVYSSGLLLALKSGELAADTIIEAFEKRDFSAAQLEGFGRPLVDGMEALRKLVHAFYTPGFSFAQFVTQHPQYRKNLVQLLVGDVFKQPIREIFEAMSAMCDLPNSFPLEQAASSASA